MSDTDTPCGGKAPTPNKSIRRGVFALFHGVYSPANAGARVACQIPTSPSNKDILNLTYFPYSPSIIEGGRNAPTLSPVTFIKSRHTTSSMRTITLVSDPS